MSDDRLFNLAVGHRLLFVARTRSMIKELIKKLSEPHGVPGREGGGGKTRYRRNIVDAAKEADIPYQLEVLERGSTDASAIYLGGCGQV